MNIRRFAAALAALFAMLWAGAALAQQPQVQELTPEQKAYVQAMEGLVKSVKPQTGAIGLSEADATLTLGEDYYFLGAEDSRRVLVEAWGNPPQSTQGVIGMVFPAGKSFLDDTWGAVIRFDEDGYVSDEDAKTINYSDLLKQLQAGEEQENQARKSAGYAALHIAGWAQQPSYDATSHSLIWAKELAFDDQEMHSLNYDVRVLGRRGVLSMNIVDEMPDIAVVRTAANGLMTTAKFNPGARYEDYKEGADKKAAYGVAGLIAGGAALAVAKKAGILGILFLVLKKGFVFIIAGAGAVWAWIQRMMGGKKGGEFGRDKRPAYYADPEPTLDPAPDAAPDTPNDPDRPA